MIVRAVTIGLAMALALASSRSAAAETNETAPAPSRAEPTPTGLRLGLRTGMALPIGDAFVSSGALSDTIRASVPLRIDVGLRIQRHFYVGAAGQLAPVLPNGCPTGTSCSGTDARFGVLVGYHLLPSATIDPWIAAGMGFEVLSMSRSSGGASVDISARGFELLDLELGADVRPNSFFRIGPVISTSIGRYARVAVNGATTSDFDTATHAWLVFGVRGAFDL